MLRNEMPTALLRGDWLPDTTLGVGPTLGPGVLLRLFLPATSYPGFGTLEEVAVALNVAEIERGGATGEVWPAHFGAWTLQPSMNSHEH